MTGHQIFEKSVRLSGLALGEFSAYTALTTVVCEVINPVFAELYYLLGKTDFVPLTDSEQEVLLDEQLIHDCLLYGVCAQLMFMFGAKEDYLIFREIYEQKRHRYFRSTKMGVVKDVFARGCDV